MIRPYHLFYILLLIPLCLSNAGLALASQEYIIQPPASWVETATAGKPSNDPEAGMDYGFYLPLIDKQTRIDQDSTSYYCHMTRQIVNHKGIQNAAQIEIDYHPASEQVILHHIVVYRKHKTINQLYARNIKVLQREERLDDNLYTGRKSLYILLEDLRVGDIVDYSYTIINTSKKYGKDFYTDIHLHGYLPLHHLSYRLLWPKTQPISIKNHGTELKPSFRDLGSHKEYTWQCKNRPLIALEDDTPGWFYPFPWVEVRTQKTWNKVAIENMVLYETPPLLSEELNLYIK